MFQAKIKIIWVEVRNFSTSSSNDIITWVGSFHENNSHVTVKSMGTYKGYNKFWLDIGLIIGEETLNSLTMTLSIDPCMGYCAEQNLFTDMQFTTNFRGVGERYV